MKLRMWQVDAFTSRPLAGNPAAVVPLESWLDDALMRAIAAENNLSETAFFVSESDGWRIRWFTPAIEVELCGHATLASAHVLLNHLRPELDGVTFASRSGPLVVSRRGERLALDLPAYPSRRIDTPPLLVEALGAEPLETWLGVKMMALFASETQVRALTPDFGKVNRIEAFGVIATAPGDGSDCASRYFVPQAGVPSYRVGLPDEVLVAASELLVPSVSVRWVGCRAFCDHPGPRGTGEWIEQGGCL